MNKLQNLQYFEKGVQFYYTLVLTKKLSDIELNIKCMKERACNVHSVRYGEKVQHSKIKDVMADQVIEYVDLEKKYFDLLGEYLDRFKTIHDILKKINDFNTYIYITQYYLHGKSNKFIAEFMHISERNLYRIQHQS